MRDRNHMDCWSGDQECVVNDPACPMEPTPRPPKEKRLRESDEYSKFVMRAIRGLGRRAAEDVDALTLLRDIGEEYNRVLDEAARNCHQTWSWGEIALRLGVTRQAAQKRWGGPDDAPCERCGVTEGETHSEDHVVADECVDGHTWE